MPKGEKKNKAVGNENIPEAVMAKEGSRIVQKPGPKKNTVQEILDTLNSGEGAVIFDMLSVADQDDLNNRFTYHPPKDGQPEAYKAVRDTSMELSALIYVLAPNSRERSLAITKLEEFVFWANAAIARNS